MSGTVSRDWSIYANLCMCVSLCTCMYMNRYECFLYESFHIHYKFLLSLLLLLLLLLRRIYIQINISNIFSYSLKNFFCLLCSRHIGHVIGNIKFKRQINWFIIDKLENSARSFLLHWKVLSLLNFPANAIEFSNGASITNIAVNNYVYFMTSCWYYLQYKHK